MALTPEQEKMLDEQEASSMSPMEYLEDWARSAAGGPRRGLESIPGTGGDAYAFMNTLYSIMARATPEEQEALYNAMDKERLLPTSEQTENVTEPYLGEHYEPKTTVGNILNLIGSSVFGGGGRHVFRNMMREHVAPAIGAVAGGAVGEELGGKGGRLFGTLAGGGLGGVTQEAVKRGVIRPATPERIENINTLQREGVELTGGQASGSEALQYMEAGPFAGKAEGIARQQAQQYTRAAMRRAGIDSDRADAATLTAAQDNFSNEYEAMIQANNGIVLDPQLETDLITHGSRYEDLKGTSRDAVGRYFNRILDAATQNGGVIPPDVFQQINGEISAALKTARNSPELAAMSDTLREFRDSMFASMERNGQAPGVADAARDLNNRYRNFKIIEKAMRGQGQETMYGFITPGNLASAVKQSESITDWAQSRGDFDDLAKAGGLTAPIKSSGTAGRALVGAMLPGAATGLGLMASGQVLPGILAATTAIGAPFAATVPGQMLTARPVRTSIVNRTRGDAPNMWTPLPIQAAQKVPLWEYGSREGMGPEGPVPVEEEPAAAAPVNVAPVPVEPLPPPPVDPLMPPDQRTELDMPVPIPTELLAFLGGRRLPMRV